MGSIGSLTNSSWEINSDHAAQGLGAMILGIPILWAIHWLLGYTRPASAEAPSEEVREAVESQTGASVWGSALGLMGLFAALGMLLPAAPESRSPALNLSEIPGAKGPWNSALLPTDFLLLGSVRFDQVLRRGYQHLDGTRVELFIGSVGSGGLRDSPFSRVTELPQTGWVVLERTPAEIAGKPGERLVLAAHGARALAYTWRIGDSGLWAETLRAALALPAGQFGAPFVVRWCGCPWSWAWRVPRIVPGRNCACGISWRPSFPDSITLRRGERAYGLRVSRA